MGVVLYFFHPIEIFTKILTIILGAAVYFGVIFLTKTFGKEELHLMRSMLFKGRKK